MTKSQHLYEVRPRKDHRGVAAISDALPFIIALIVGGVLVSILLYFGSFLVTRRQDARLRSPHGRKDHCGVDLISDALPFGRLWYGEPNAISNAIGYAQHRSRSHDAVISVYDEAGNVIETHEPKGDFIEP